MTGPVTTGIGDSIRDIWDSITGVPGSIVDGLSLVSDPIGWTFAKVQEAVDGLVTNLLPWLMRATKPDLTLDWFITQYRYSFAIAIMVWLLIVLGRILAVARGAASGGDLLELLTTRSMTFIAGAMWGPAIGWVIIGIFHALSEGILALFSTSTDEALSSLLEMIRDGDWLALPGGLFFAIGLLICMLISLAIVVIMLIVAMVALYLSGVIFPLGWVWITDDPARRPIAYKFAWLWLGLNAAHPLMFMMLGASFALIAGMAPMSTEPGIKLLIHTIVAIVVMIMTAVSPVLLFRFAPVLPTTSGQNAPSFNMGGSGDGGGPSNDLRQVADDSASAEEPNDASSDSTDGGAGDGGSGTGGGGATSGDGDSAPGPLEREAMNAPGAEEGGSQETPGGAGSGEAEGAAEGEGDQQEGHTADLGSGSDPSTDELGGGSSEDVDGPGESSSPGAGPGPTPLGASSTGELPDPSSEGGEAGVGEASTGGSAGAGASAAETTATVGAAETGTGVGAVVGVPTLIAAAGMEAASKAVDAGEQGAQMAASDMDEQGAQQ